MISGVGNIIGGTFEAVPQVSNGLTSAVDYTVTGVGSTLTGVVNAVGGVLNGLANLLASFGRSVGSFGSSIGLPGQPSTAVANSPFAALFG